MKIWQLLLSREFRGSGIILLSCTCLYAQNLSVQDTRVVTTGLQGFLSQAWYHRIAINTTVETKLSGDWHGNLGGGQFRGSFTYRRDHDRAEYRGGSVFQDDAGVSHSPKSQINIVDGHRYWHAQDEANGAGLLVFTSCRNLQQDEQDIVHSIEAGGFLDGNLMRFGSLSEWLQKPDTIHMQLASEEVNGASCRVLHVETVAGDLTVWVSPDQGYAPVKYRLHVSAESSLGKERLASTGINDTVLEVVSTVEKHDEAFIPVTGTLRMLTSYADGRKTERIDTVRRTNIDTNPDFEALRAFKLAVPDGTRVFDNDFPSIAYEWRNGQLAPLVDQETVNAITRDMRAERAADGLSVGEAAASRPVGNGAEKGSSSFCRNGPADASHKMNPTPFRSRTLQWAAIGAVAAVLIGGLVYGRCRKRPAGG